jgi:RNA polymerase sigma-70 factor (ECF subfamily)
LTPSDIRDSPPHTLSDNALVEGVQIRGDSLCFEEIHARYRTRLRSYCLASLRDASEAEDAVQCIFLKVHKYLYGYHGGSFRAWLLEIARNECLNRIRAQSSRPATIELTNEFEISSDQSGALIVENGELIRSVLEQLPERQRVILKLIYVEGLSYREASQLTGWAEGQVRSYLQNGRRRFQLAWEKQMRQRRL